VTQPTLSNGIAQLEDELQERLFVRTTRKVSLTPFGVHILPYISEVLSSQETLLRQSQAFLRPEKRLIRIGTSPLVSANLLGLMIEPFRRLHPQVDIVLREMNIKDLYRLLEEGVLDFVFGITDTYKGPWTATFLYSEELLFIPSGAVWVKGNPKQSVQLKEIASETYVMVPDACGLSRTTRALFHSHRLKLNEYSGEAMSYQVLEEWAMLGIGAAILPMSKLAAASNHPSFSIINKAGDKIMLEFEATWSREDFKLQHLRDFSLHLQTIVPGIISGLSKVNI
jgi:DNA-binding transcriptional LysR family regulator